MILHLTEDQILEIHREALENDEPHGVLDFDALSACVSRPQNGYFVTVYECAAALLAGLAQRHVFQQGNKRTAWMSCVVFLEMNHVEITCDDDEAIEFVLWVVLQKPTVNEVAMWILERTQLML